MAETNLDDGLTIDGQRGGTGEEVFGIDLGTTYSAIAWLNDDKIPEIIRNFAEDVTTPSAVFFNSDDDILVGKRAKEEAQMEPAQLATFWKRNMGENGPETHFTPKDSNGNAVGRDFSPIELSAILLRQLVHEANKKIRSEIKNVIITCPAYFGNAAREATKKAGELAGLNVLHVINEPTAAALARGQELANTNKKILVYDLGGGTFDVTALQVKDGTLDVICSGGDRFLGGKDWDAAMVQLVFGKWKEQSKYEGDFESLSIADKLLLQLNAENWKITLSGAQMVRCPVALEAGRARVEVTREEFEEATSGLLAQTISATERTLEEAKTILGVEFVPDEFLLVGGSSLMPMVTEKVKESFGVDPILFDPNQAVAKGAAVYPLIEKPEDVLGKSYGIVALKDHKEIVFNLLLKGQKVKEAKFVRLFRTPNNNMISLDINITESDNGLWERNKDVNGQERLLPKEDAEILNTYHLELPEACPKGDEVEACFEMDANMILHVTATHLRTNTKLEVTLETKPEIIDEPLPSLPVED